MSVFTINILDTSDVILGSVVPDVGFRYTDNLNDIDIAELKFSGTSVLTRGLIALGNGVNIYKDASLVFKGIINLYDTLDGGTLVIQAQDRISFRLSKENGTYTNSPWTSTASATIFSDIIGDSSFIDAGTINAGFALDFRLTDTQSIWNSITNLAKKTTQDIGKDYTNLEIDILDHKGSSTSIATFNNGIDIQNLRVTQGFPLGNRILVKGKGDGDNQATGEANDATSQSNYGVITRTVVDRSCISDDECDALAAAELALTKDPSKIYDFDIINVNQDLESGDILTLNATDVDLTDEEVRVVGIERGSGPKGEYLKVQVVNPELKSLLKTRNKIISRIIKDNQDANSYMEGQRNIHPINGSEICDASNPLQLRVYIPSYVVDESGNNRIRSVKLDYSLKNYKKIVNATEDVTLVAVDTANRMTGTTDNTASYYTQVTDFGDVEDALIDDHNHDLGSNTSGSYTMMSDEGADSATGETLTGGWDNNTLSEGISGTFDFIYCRVIMQCDFSSSSVDCGCRIHVSGNYWVNRVVMNFDTNITDRVIRETFIYPVFGSVNTTVYVDFYSGQYQDYNLYLQVWGGGQSHTHSIPTQSGGSTTGAKDEQVYFQKVDTSNFTIESSAQDTDTLVYEVVDTSDTTVVDTTGANRVTGTILDLTEVATTATGIKLDIDSVNRTTAVFGGDPHNSTEDEDIDITDYVKTPGWHLINIYPQGDKAFTLAEIRVDFALDS